MILAASAVSLRMKGWIVPAYPLPAGLSHLTVQRIVVRNGLSMDLAERLLTDIADAVGYLGRIDAPMPAEGHRPGFTH